MDGIVNCLSVARDRKSTIPIPALATGRNFWLAWVFALHLPMLQPGAIRAVYRDSAIVTIYHDSQLIATYRDCAKTHANPDTDGNSLYHRAVMLKPQQVTRQLRLDRKGLSITSKSG